MYLVRQWNNVLFDFTLSGLEKVMGVRNAERLATSTAVLIFFWGAFAFVCSMARRPAWSLLPCLAIFAYGWTFEMGFMNYYVSIGLAFFGLALLKSGVAWEKSWVVILGGLIWLAHPLGLAFLICGAGYLLVTEFLAPRYQLLLFAVSALLIVAVHCYINARVHQGLHGYGIIWKLEPGLVQDGHDQLLLYGHQYLLPSYLLHFLIWASIIFDVVARRHSPRWWSSYLLPAQLYGLVLLAAALLPAYVQMPQFAAPVVYLTERLTSVSAILACCLVAAGKRRKWHFAGFALIAALFFFCLYKDTATINGMEDQAGRLVHTLPPQQRVVSKLSWSVPGSRIGIQHIVDRACIGWCFSYGNYEPSSRQFRIRAWSGNPIAMSDSPSTGALDAGKYLVQKPDLPLFEIYQCDSRKDTLCIRELRLGETVGSRGQHRLQ